MGRRVSASSLAGKPSSPPQTMYSLPLLPFVLLILGQTNPTQSLFWRPAANYHRGWHTFLWGSGGNRRQDNGGGVSISRPTVDNSINTINTSSSGQCRYRKDCPGRQRCVRNRCSEERCFFDADCPASKKCKYKRCRLA